MKKVKYIGRTNTSLTNGREYEVVEQGNYRFHIINDQNKKRYYKNNNINFENVIDTSDRTELERIEVLADKFIKSNGIKSMFVKNNQNDDIMITHFMFEFLKFVKENNDL